MTLTEIPALVRERLLADYGDEAAAVVLDGYQQARNRPVTLRANTLKTTADDVARALADAGIDALRVPWYDDAFVVPHLTERSIWDLPLYQQGKVYLQSLSSMLPPLALQAQAGADILDMCAAPGGKTSQIAALTHGQAHLTAVEMSPVRADKLEYNMNKLGVKNVPIMRTDARKLDTFFSFDQILLDAPCTGSGTFAAGDERACKNITPKLLSKVTRSQRDLLDRALKVLKPGGCLIYSTCSIFAAENDEQVRGALTRHRDCEVKPLDLPDIFTGELAATTLPSSIEGALTVCPSRLYEGFYLCRIEKKTTAKKR